MQWRFPSEPLTCASFCTGAGGFEVAVDALGCYRPLFFSEIEAFCCSLLAQRWPEVSNFGDLTKLDCSWWRHRIDVVWGSTPCQAFSFAGRRKGLKDKRGALTLAFVDRVDEIDPLYTLWENVKGVLSDKSNAFGCLLGALAGTDGPLVPPGKRWGHAGYVVGPRRTVAWRLSDAQHGGVPQRRERVFLVASARGGADPRDILFESEGVRRDIAPRREAEASVAALTARGVGTCGADDNQAQAGHLIPVAFGGNNTAGPIDVATALTAHGGPHGRLDFETETFLVLAEQASRAVSVTGDVTHALKAEGADASEDGTGRGNPLVAFADPHAFDARQSYVMQYGAVTGPLDTDGGTVAIAFSAKDDGSDASPDLAPALRAMGHDGSHANAGGQLAMAFAENDRGELRVMDVAGTLAAKGGKPGQGYQAIVTSEVYQGHGSNVGPMGALRAGNGNEAGGVPFLAEARTTYAIQERAVCENPDAGPDGAGFRPDIAYTLEARTTAQMVAYAAAMRGREGGSQIEVGGEVANALRSSEGGWRALALIVDWAEAIVARVRRLTPLECERLQGLPDYHTRIRWRGKPAELCPDGPRYRVIGNGLAIPDVRWLCARVAHFHHLKQQERLAA